MGDLLELLYNSLTSNTEIYGIYNLKGPGLVPEGNEGAIKGLRVVNSVL